MKRRLMVLVLVAAVVAIALLVFVPLASAANVTKIMYAQENTEYFKYTPSTSGTLWVQIGWTSAYGSAGFPQAEVDGSIFGPYGLDLFSDYNVMTLRQGTNPEVGHTAVEAGKTYYIGVQPYVADCEYTIDARLGDSYESGSEITCTRTSNDATVTMPQTGQAYAADGEFYAPSAGDWISQVQTWPGSSSLYYACWYDLVYERVSGSSYDTLSEITNTVQYPPQLPPSRNTINAAGSGSGPRAQKWYSVTPEIWPSYKVPNNRPADSSPEPAGIAWTTAPAWYTYSYPDDSVTAQKMGYLFSSANNINASKRSYCGNTSTNSVVSYSFYGTSVDWYYTQTSVGAKANVLIDGVAPTPEQGPAVVDQSSPDHGFHYKVKASYTGLSNDPHTITISNSGLAGQYHVVSPSTVLLTHDAFVATDSPGDPTTWDENNYDGSTTYKFTSATPPGNPNPAPYGGTYSGSTSTNDAVACFFKGTSVDFYYTQTSVGCKANVLIDGEVPGSSPTAAVGPAVIDQSSSDHLFHYLVKASYTGLADTTHIILIYNTGQLGQYHIASPSTALFTVDAFNYTPTLQPTVWVDDK